MMSNEKEATTDHLKADGITAGRPELGSPTLAVIGEVLREAARHSPADADKLVEWLKARTDPELVLLKAREHTPSYYGYTGPYRPVVVPPLAEWVLDVRGVRRDRKSRLANGALLVILAAVLGALLTKSTC